MYKTLHKKQGSVTVQLRFARSSVTFCAKRDSYADHCQLKLKKTVDAPTIQTSVSAPNYEERYESTETIQGDMYIPLLANEYNIGEGDICSK